MTVNSVTLEILCSISDSLEQGWLGVRWVRDVLSVSEWYISQPETPDNSQFSSVFSQVSSRSVKSANVYKLNILTEWTVSRLLTCRG